VREVIKLPSPSIKRSSNVANTLAEKKSQAHEAFCFVPCGISVEAAHTVFQHADDVISERIGANKMR
jgi:hypothetical protein